MAHCDLCNSCFFFNEQKLDMPRTAEFLKDKYCKRDFAGCARFLVSKSYGKDRVPESLYPNDTFETLKIN
jgi:hypothetical protein